MNRSPKPDTELAPASSKRPFEDSSFGLVLDGVTVIHDAQMDAIAKETDLRLQAMITRFVAAIRRFCRRDRAAIR